jgi:hypothetical protein
MNLENNIISKIELPEGYNIRIGKSLWYSSCFLLDILAATLSRVSSPDLRALSFVVLTLSVLAAVLSAYYFYTFRDKVRWVVAGITVLSCLFTIELLIRVWTGLSFI